MSIILLQYQKIALRDLSFSLFVCLLEPCSLPSMTLPSCKPQMVCFIKAFFLFIYRDIFVSIISDPDIKHKWWIRRL